MAPHRSRKSSPIQDTSYEEMLEYDAQEYVLNEIPLSQNQYSRLLTHPLVLETAPPKSGPRFPNYKGTFSIILLACVDANYKFVLVDIGAEDHNSDVPVVALSKDKAIYNYRLSRARRCVENAIWIYMASLFRIFRKPLVSSLETSTFTVVAAVCLHNFIKSTEKEVPFCERRYCPLDFADNGPPEGSINDGRW
ncbi:nuclease harbi1-like protein [Trichonephila inaurata madagascariensis]|uniref:Nuclease harbi1-like protein n=1 Tax=Trichonephila inaurata madagascariensis TaxID=2747483 RepID=A0A8X6XND0_9ARAC|nr:nuclease harbi1-like protein [Trichonephila inaurata madagascariensis]